MRWLVRSTETGGLADGRRGGGDELRPGPEAGSFAWAAVVREWRGGGM